MGKISTSTIKKNVGKVCTSSPAASAHPDDFVSYMMQGYFEMGNV